MNERRGPSRPARSLALLGVMLFAVAFAAGGEPAPAGVDWTVRLEALAPDAPMAYFELAEEVADAAESEDDRRLARRLFALAGTLHPDRLGRSACLALADLAESEVQRRRLLALAMLLRDEGAGLLASLGSEVDPAESPDADVALALAEAFSFYRRGEGTRALAELRRPGVEALAAAHEHVLRGGLDRFLEDCRLYRGRLRPSLGEDDVTRMMHLEMALLAGEDRPWSGDLLVHRGQPLIEVDPDRLAESLGVDPQRCLFRGGRWVRP